MSVPTILANQMRLGASALPVAQFRASSVLESAHFDTSTCAL